MNEKEQFIYTLQGCIYDLKEYVLNFNDKSLIHKSQECIDYLSRFFFKSIDNSIRKNKDKVWIDKSHNDRISIERKDFVNELSRALYYNIISQKASTIFLQWFDEYGNEVIRK